MATAISITEILGTIRDESVEICATADAEYDPATEVVAVTLGAFARRISTAGDGQHLPEPWLPRQERIVEHLPRCDADDFAKDVFKSWTKKVRAAVPPELGLKA